MGYGLQDKQKPRYAVGAFIWYKTKTLLRDIIMSNFPEVGYTPANLRFLLESKGWTQKVFAEKMGVTLLTVARWVADISVKNHRDMSHAQWLIALELEQPNLPQ